LDKEQANAVTDQMLKKTKIVSKFTVLRPNDQEPPKAMSTEEVKRLAERELAAMRDEPEAHFKKLKAIIKLKAVKEYEEDKIRQAEEELKKQLPVIVVKDRLGRIIEKKSPNFASKKQASTNRKPVKRQPPKRLASFTEAQMRYYFKDDIFNPLNKK